MNYSKVYDNLIYNAKNRTLDGCIERHHIVPRCLGGTDDPDNIVCLTPEEHYVAHQLLIKIYNDVRLVYAANMMVPNRISNKIYGWIRRRFIIAKKAEQKGQGNSQFGLIWISNVLLKQSKRIDKSLEIPDGWIVGRNSWKKIESLERKKLEKISKRDEEIEKYRRYYKIYAEGGFEKLVSDTGYAYSKQNFVQRCSKLLSEFVPQNGKKRM